MTIKQTAKLFSELSELGHENKEILIKVDYDGYDSYLKLEESFDKNMFIETESFKDSDFINSSEVVYEEDKLLHTDYTSIFVIDLVKERNG